MFYRKIILGTHFSKCHDKLKNHYWEQLKKKKDTKNMIEVLIELMNFFFFFFVAI